jgi:hypothetical protein
MMRTKEQQMALFEIQSALPPELLDLVSQWAKELAAVPESELGRFVNDMAVGVYRDVLKQEPPVMPESSVMDRDLAINNIGHLLMLILKKTYPEMSDTMQHALPFAAVELLREKMKAN